MDDEPYLFSALKAVSLALLIIWIIAANLLVFVVLFKNPKLQTVPNLLVGNLAFSDVAVAVIVLPFSATNTVMQRWVFGGVLCEAWLSSDILCCTASIWNLSIVGLDRYWAITSPVSYLQKRTKVTAAKLIAFVWVLSGLISLAPLLGWKSAAPHEYLRFADNQSNVLVCQFLELPAYTIYSATGSFYVPCLLMFFVYAKIYKAFAIHRQKALYRQTVIRNHITATVLHHDVSTLMPTKKQFNKEDSSSSSESEEDEIQSNEEKAKASTSQTILRVRGTQSTKVRESPYKGRPCNRSSSNDGRSSISAPLKYDVLRGRLHPQHNSNTKSDRPTFSASKERRGVRVLGIILGCFTLCWTPFFIIYTMSAFCTQCLPNMHVYQFITWLGYSNSAMNPIIYTVFNRDYQNALKRLFGVRTARKSTKRRRLAMLLA